MTSDTALETVYHFRPQAARVFMDELARHKIEVVSAPGEAIHIDWVNTTAATPEDLIQQASKTYLDWYMLTQVSVINNALAVPLSGHMFGSRVHQRSHVRVSAA